MKVLLNGAHQSSVLEFCIFEFTVLTIFFVFVNMVPLLPYGSKIFKTLLVPQKTTEYFETSHEFSSQYISQKYCFWYLKFEFLIFNEFLKFTIVPYGEAKNFSYLGNERP